MRVVVAMSGGVDSSAAAALLVEQGHEVVGITLRVWSYEGAAKCGSCCAPEDIDDARAVAERLKIPFYVADAEELFKEQVVKPFVGAYLQGRTPIPCVACNRDVKFGFLLRRARALGAKLATGHYARVETASTETQLLRGADASKDQSYFLFTLGQDELRDLIFPVGHLSKAQVREVAERHQLPTSRKPESMEICFVPDGDYAKFVEKVAGPQPGGDIVDREGKVLGVHPGIHHYTVGQRKGLGVSHPLPLYVQKIDPEARRVVVGSAAEAEVRAFEISGATWTGRAPSAGDSLRVKIRHRHAGAAARVELQGENRALVQLVPDEKPVRGVTPGQAAVFYDGDRVVGGGWICNPVAARAAEVA